MNHDEGERPGWVRLPREDDPDHPRGAGSRAGGVHRVRRASNWTVAALVAGVAATTGYFAHQIPAATSATNSATQAAPGQGAPGQGTPGHAAVAGPHKASVSTPVVTSGGSGVAAGSGTSGTAGTAGRSGTVTWRDN